MHFSSTDIHAMEESMQNSAREDLSSIEMAGCSDVNADDDLLCDCEITISLPRPMARLGWDRSLLVSFLLAISLHGSMLAAVVWHFTAVSKPDVEMASGTGSGHVDTDLIGDAGTIRGIGGTPLPKNESRVNLPVQTALPTGGLELSESPGEVATSPRDLILYTSEQTPGWIGISTDAWATSVPTRRRVESIGISPTADSDKSTSAGTKANRHAESSGGDSVGGGGNGGGLPTALSGNRPPNYPADAIRHRVQGTTILRVAVLANGTVGDLHIAESSGSDLLDQAAIAAVWKWHFMSGTKDGKPIDCEVNQEVRFVLQRGA